MARWLDRDSTTGLERRVPASAAQRLLDEIATRNVRPTAAEAAAMAQTLVGLYPAREVNDPTVYVAGMTALLAAYPSDFVRRVVNPVSGLPTRLKWLPTLAEVREALDAEQTRRDRIVANARYVVAEDDRNRQKARDDAEWERNRLSAEKRQAQVAALLKVRTMDELDARRASPPCEQPASATRETEQESRS